MRRMNAAIESSMIVKVQDRDRHLLRDNVRMRIHRRSWWHVRVRLIAICRTLASDITGAQ